MNHPPLLAFREKKANLHNQSRHLRGEEKQNSRRRRGNTKELYKRCGEAEQRADGKAAPMLPTRSNGTSGGAEVKETAGRFTGLSR